MLYYIIAYKKFHSIHSSYAVRTFSKISQLFCSLFCKMCSSVSICFKNTKKIPFDSQRHLMHLTRISSYFSTPLILHRQNEKKSRKCKSFFSNFQLSATFVHTEKIARYSCMLFITMSSIDILNARCPRGVLKKFYIQTSQLLFSFGLVLL